MTGLGIRIYTDENVDPLLAIQLRRHGYDALSCHSADNHNQAMSDESQLEFATAHERAILTHNIADFVQLDGIWKAAGKVHTGIICAPGQPSIGELVNRTMKHLNSCSPEDQFDTTHWI